MSERELPEGWREVTWAEISTLKYGRALRRVVDSDGRTEVFGTNGPIGWTTEAPLASGPKVIIGRKGAYRGVHLAEGDFWVIDTAFWLETEEDVDARWAYYSLKLADINGLDAGSAIPSTTRQGFGSLLALVPPLKEQRAIAEVLGALDDKIAANTALVQLLRETALAFASRVSAFGKVSDLARHTRSQVTPADMTDEVVHHYSLPAFDAGSGPDVVPPETIKSSKFRVVTPSVLVSKLNPRFPRIWDLPTLDEHSALASTEFVVLEPLAVSSSLLWALIAQPAVSVELEAQVAGTSGSHQRVKPEAILAATVGDPSTLSAADLEGIAGCSARAHAVHHETSRLTATRDALLPALMSGRLTVRDAEALAEEAGL